MNRLPVTSGLITSIGFENGILEIQFKTGSIYQYTGVSPETVAELRAAPSVGKYFLKFLKNQPQYPATKV